MCEFKKGDKVICINTDNHPELIKNKIYEVEKPNGDFVYLKGCKYGYFTFLFRKECEYCRESEKLKIAGKIIATFEWKETAGYEAPKNRNDFLEMFILKGKNDKKAGLMINSGCGFRYIDINYCPKCRTKTSQRWTKRK